MRAIQLLEAIAAALYFVYQIDANAFKAALCMAYALMVKLKVNVKKWQHNLLLTPLKIYCKEK